MVDTAVRTHSPSLSLHAGDWVVVRSKEEILATLDAGARVEGLPFQPEMFAFCNRRMRIAKVAHKSCDTINKTGGRKMERAFHLEGSRCDGAKHGGCQADCVFYWKEEWLRSEDTPKPLLTPAQLSPACTEETVLRRVVAPGQENDPDPRWVCQTTCLYEATTLLKWWDVRQYVKDVASGNHSAWHMAKLLIAAGYRNLAGMGIGYRALVKFYDAFQSLRGGKPFPAIDGKIAEGSPTPVDNLGLKPGDLVEVKSGEEIAATITPKGFNRGMRYDVEMLKYSGGRYRVQMLVDRLINENTGKMMVMKTPCIQLEDVYCRAECAPHRIGCPRGSNTYWREIWLRRVPAEKA